MDVISLWSSRPFNLKSNRPIIIRWVFLADEMSYVRGLAVTACSIADEALLCALEEDYLIYIIY